MDSKLNNAAEKDYFVAFNVFSQEEVKRKFPPEAGKVYPLSLTERALTKWIKDNGGLEIQLQDGNKEQVSKKISEKELDEK